MIETRTTHTVHQTNHEALYKTTRCSNTVQKNNIVFGRLMSLSAKYYQGSAMDTTGERGDRLCCKKTHIYIAQYSACHSEHVFLLNCKGTI